MAGYGWVLDEDKFLCADEVKALRKSMDSLRKKGTFLGVRNWFLVELCLNTGLRVDEVVKLRHGDLFARKERASVLVRVGKGNKSRIVRISQNFKKVCGLFISWKQKMGLSVSAHEPFITKSNGKAITTRGAQKVFAKCAKIAGIRRTNIHTLRHTYGAFFLKASGFNVRLLQKQLGHASIRTTETYANLLDPDIEDALENLSDIYRKI